MVVPPVPEVAPVTGLTLNHAFDGTVTVKFVALPSALKSWNDEVANATAWTAIVGFEPALVVRVPADAAPATSRATAKKRAVFLRS